MIHRSGAHPGRLAARPNTTAAADAPAAVAPRQRPARRVTCLIWALVVFNIVPSNIFEDKPLALDDALAKTVVTMPTEGTALSKTIWLSLLVIGLAMTASRMGKVRKLLARINPFLLGFFALAAASVLWSIDPGITLKRVVTASTILVDAIALAVASWRPTRFQSVLRPVLTALLLASIVFVFAEPALAIEQKNQIELMGAWHGLTAQKNAFGSLSAIAFLLWLHAWLTREASGWQAVIGAAIAAVCLVSSRSSTSLMATIFAGILLLMMLRSPTGLRRYLPYLIGLFVCTLLVYSLAVLNLLPGSNTLLSPIAAITGKDQTFSGRTAIWAILNDHIARAPVLGSGYSAYWVEKPGSPSMEMLQRLYFYPTEGHNGYLDAMNDLGAVGALCLLGFLFVFLRQGLRLFAAMRSQGALYLTLLFLQMIGNLSESRWFNSLDFNFVIMTLATVSMGRTLMDLPGRVRRQPVTASAAMRPSSWRSAVARD